jgi:Resolvase, N terminal domain
VCGRFTQNYTWAEVHAFLSVFNPPRNLQPHYNIAPTRLGKDGERELVSMRWGFEAGDVLTVTRLDRLARSTRDLLNTLANIAGKETGFRSLGDAWADTTTSHGRLMLTVLGGLAEFEARSYLGAHSQKAASRPRRAA